MAVARRVLLANGAAVSGGGGTPLPSFNFPGMPLGFIVADSTGQNWQLTISSAAVNHTTVEACSVNPALRWLTYSGGGGGSITSIASADASVAVTGGTGPAVDLSVAPCPMVLVKEILVGTSAAPNNVEVSSIAVSGLSGDVDNTYYVQIDGIGGSDSTAGAGLVWTLNGGLGTMSYMNMHVQGQTAHAVSGAGSTTLAAVATGAAPTKAWTMVGTMTVKTGRQRTFVTQFGLFDATDANNQFGQAYAQCSETATAITSFTLASTGVKIWGVGSRLRVWKMATTV